jgi:hypothetical protein
MEEPKILDIAHISFLETINLLIAQSGPPSAKGTLMRLALKAAEGIPPAEYATLEDFVRAIGDGVNPITRVEGRADHVGGGVFGLPKCPFAASISSYKNVFGKLPDGYAELTAEFNRTSPATEKYRIGAGAGVSPFCAVHQTIRSAIGERIRIGGKKVAVWQLGCKSGAGQKGLAAERIKACGVAEDDVVRNLDGNMCCYAVRTAAGE